MRSRYFTFFIAGLALVAGCTKSPSKEAAPAASAQVAVANPIKDGLTIAYHAGREGSWEPCGCQTTPYGGLDRELNALTEMRKAGEVLYLDAGDLFAPRTGKVAYDSYKAKAPGLVSILNELGLQAFSPGPADFALGVDFLKTQSKAAKFPFISTNVVDAKGKPVFEPFKVFEVKGKKVAVFGIVPPTTKVGKGFKVLDPKKAVLAQVAAAGKTDLVILLSGQGKHEADRALGVLLSPVNVIIGNDPRLTLKRAEPSEKQLLIDGHQYGFYLGKVVLDLKQPLTGFYSDEVRKEREQSIAGYEAAYAELPDDKRKAALRKRIDGMKKLYPAEPVAGASRYTHELIALDSEHYGTANSITPKMAAEKERVKKAAIETAPSKKDGSKAAAPAKKKK